MTDRRYGRNKYGDGKLYGASDASNALAWDCSIDWDGDYMLSDNESNLMTNVSIDRGRKRLLKPFGGGFEPIKTGKAVVTLKNRDGRFDGWNTSSALYPNVISGKDIRIQVRDLSGSAAPYPLFRGVITDIIPTGTGRDEKVVIHASDGLDFLRNIPARVAMQQDITPDEAIALILDSVSWPSRWGRDLDVSAETIRYWWASGNKKAMSEIEDLALSFLGYFFHAATGEARYIKRSSVGDITANFAQEYLLKDIGNPQPYEILRNVTRLKVHPRTAAATGVIWQLLGNTPSVLPGAANAITLFANYKYSNVAVPAINVISPVATTDYTMNTLSNGAGTDQTANCTVVITDFGDTAKLVITNNSGGTVYITKLQVRGDAIYEPNASDVTYPSDLTSVLAPRELVFDLLWQQDINVALDIVSVLGPFYAGLHPMPNVKIENRPSLQFPLELFDIVSADIDKLGLSGVSFRIGGIEHKSDPQFENCQRVTSRFYLEPYISADDFMQWDTNSVWDTSTVFGY
jgi:hypothetical protein